MTNQKISLKYIVWIAIAVLFTWVIHEFAHWLAYQILGYEALMTLNKVTHIGEIDPTDRQGMLTSAAGPLITIVQGIIVFIVLKSKGWNKYLYPFLFVAFYMRLVAGLINVVNLNDEGRISEYFGIGTYTVPAIVSGLLFFLVYKISAKYQLHWKFHALTTFIVIMFSTLLIVSDQFFDLRIL